MKKLEKKQIPQFVALCILSSGVFGYFVVRMVTPTVAAASVPAPPRTAAAPVKNADAPTVPGTTTAVATGTPTAGDPAMLPAGDPALLVTPPSPGMRDPFVVGYVEPKTPVAAAPPAAPLNPAVTGTQMARTSLPGLALPAPLAPELPSGLSGFSIRPTRPASVLPMPPAAPAPPTWTVTGVVQTDTEQLAILRNGEARRIVRSGDFVDSTYRVTDVTRTSVVLRHGTASYRLLLGGDKPAAVSPAPASFGAPPAFTAPPMFTAPPVFGTPPAPAAPARRPGLPNGASLTRASRSLSRVARLWLRATPTLPDHARTVRPQPQLALRFLDNVEVMEK